MTWRPRRWRSRAAHSIRGPDSPRGPTDRAPGRWRGTPTEVPLSARPRTRAPLPPDRTGTRPPLPTGPDHVPPSRCGDERPSPWAALGGARGREPAGADEYVPRSARGWPDYRAIPVTTAMTTRPVTPPHVTAVLALAPDIGRAHARRHATAIGGSSWGRLPIQDRPRPPPSSRQRAHTKGSLGTCSRLPAPGRGSLGVAATGRAEGLSPAGVGAGESRRRAGSPLLPCHRAVDPAHTTPRTPLDAYLIKMEGPLPPTRNRASRSPPHGRDTADGLALPTPLRPRG